MTTPAHKPQLDELEAEYARWCQSSHRDFEQYDSFNAWVAESQAYATRARRQLVEQLERRLFPKGGD